MKYAVINGTGSYLPEKVLTNDDLQANLDTSHEWIYSRTGIARRHIAGEGESTGFMAAEAAKQALEASGLEADQIDLIVVATCTPDFFFPGVASYVQQQLKMSKTIPAFDLSAACSGFIYAMDVAKQYVCSEAAKHVLVIGSERMSSAVDWTDRASCVLFGDGAGALILSASDVPGILASKLHAQYDAAHLLSYPNGSNLKDRALVTMQGHDVFKFAVKYMGEIVDEVLAAAHLEQEAVDWLIPHQANIRIIQAIAKKLELPMSRVVLTIEDQGNTSAASIPLALDFAIRSGKIKSGDVLLLEAFGGGMTWGALLLKYLKN